MTNARVIGWGGAGKNFSAPAQDPVEMNAPTDLVTGGLARIDREVGVRVGVEIVVVRQCPGEDTVLPGERIRYLYHQRKHRYEEALRG